MTSMFIRPAKLSDLRAANSIFSVALPMVPKNIRLYALSRPYGVVSAVQGGRVVGFYVAMLKGAESVLWLDYLAVDPGLQGQGIGRELLCDCEAAAAMAGAARVELAAFTVNRRAIKFYELSSYNISSVATKEGRLGFVKELDHVPSPRADKRCFAPIGSRFKRSLRMVSARIILEFDELVCRSRGKRRGRPAVAPEDGYIKGLSKNSPNLT